MANKVINIDIKTDVSGIKNLKTELRETKEALQQATDPKEMERLVQKAAELQDKMADVNEQIAVFASGSKYEQVSNSLGQVGKSIANLDFGKAEERAQAFATAASKITFGDAIGSVKQLTGTFLKMGKALLTNPLFLIGAVIALVVVGIYKLLESMGVIKKMFDAVGMAIEWVINLFKSLLDWMGLTDYAGEEAHNKEMKRLQKAAEHRKVAMEAFQQNQKSILNAMDNEIALRRAMGEDVEELEREKLQTIRASSEAELLVKEKTAQAIALMTGKDSIEHKRAMMQIEEARQVFLKAQNEIDVFEATILTNRRNRSNEASKIIDQEIEKRKQAAEKEKAILEQLRLLRINQEQELYAQIENIENDYYNSKLSREEQEVQAIREKYFNVIEQARANGIETAELEEQQQAVISEIQDRYARERGEKRIQDEMSLRSFMNDIELNERDKFMETLAMQEEEDILKLKGFLDRKLLTEEEYQIALKELQEGFTNQREGYDREQAEKTKEEKIAMAMQYAQAASGIISSVAGLAAAMGSKETKDKEAQAKKQFKIDKAAALVTAAINTALAISKYSGNIPMQILAGVTGALSIATIASKQFSSGAGSTPSLPSAPSMTEQSAVSPTFNMFGSGGSANQLSPNETIEGSQNITVTAVVSETEVTGTQDKIKRMNENSEL